MKEYNKLIRDKIDQIDKSAIHHFFGRLQSNKVKYLVGKVSLIQSVDSLPLAKVISEKSLKLGIVTNILLEVNFSNDQNKGGFSEIELSDNIDKITKLDGICVKGLMSVLPKMDTEEKLAQSFDEIRKVYDYYKSLYPDFSILSMGMSSDYKTAIKHGSNMIRIGTDIFGPRDYGDK